MYRIELEGKSVDEIIALVEAKVAEAAESSIQSMYSRKVECCTLHIYPYKERRKNTCKCREKL